MSKKKRYETVFFISQNGIGLEGHVISEKKNGWLTIESVFTRTVYKRRRSKVYTEQEYKDALLKHLWKNKLLTEPQFICES